MVALRIAVLAAAVAFAVIGDQYDDTAAGWVAVLLLAWAAFGDWDSTGD